MPKKTQTNDFNLIPGKAYMLKTSIWAAPHDPTGMTSNPQIPLGTLFISWPYPKLPANIATDEGIKLDGRLYDFAIWNESIPVGCHRFYRVAAEHLEEAAGEITVK